jgi:penicillin-binding protein 2
MRHEELDKLRSRTSVVAYGIVAVMLIFVAGFWHLQMAQSGYYLQLSDNNQFKQIPLVAPRGQILDREGRVIVDNRPSYDVVYVREGSKHTVDETIEAFATGLGRTREELLQIVRRKQGEAKYRPIALKEDINGDDIAFVKARLMDYPEIRVEFTPRRKYIDQIAAHAIGYVGEVSTEDLKREDFKQYESGDVVGKTGLERKYNNILMGTDGYRLVVVDSLQRQKQVLKEEPPIKGSSLKTTIDLDLQRAAEEALGEQTGAAIAIDPLTGEVLVMASKPSFDANLFASKISGNAYQAIITDPRQPLRNRVIQNHYSPGSVFKVFMTVAGLESETLNPLEHVNCSGLETIYGQAKHCWRAGGHGSISLHDALVNSCNIFFYHVGKGLDIDKIAYYARTMGLGRVSGIDIPNENAGIIPDRAWKANYYKTKSKSEQVWRDAETLSVAIGQSYVSVTPMQVTWAMGGLASGGKLFQAHLVNPEYLNKLGFKGRPVVEESYPVGAETLDIVRNAMWGVVNDGAHGGTGTRAKVPGFDVAGKTGTAQVVGLDKQKKGDEDTADNAWFVGYAPYRSPEIVVGVFVEHGGHGGDSAAPVAHAIFETFYKKKTGQFTPASTGQIAQIRTKP